MPLLRRPGTAWSRPSSASATEPRPRPAVRSGLGGATPVALADIGEADVPRLPTGIGELDRVLGGGLVPGSLVLRRRRARDRQVHAPAPGRGRARRARCCTRPARSRRRRSACAPGASACSTGAAGSAVEVLAEHDVGRIVEVARATRPAVRRRRLDPDRDRRRARRGGRQRRPGPRSRPCASWTSPRARASRSSSSAT